MKLLAILACAVTLSACAKPASDAPAALPTSTGGQTAPAAPARDLTGRWIGVEGMYLTVGPGDAPGRYRLEMQWDLDHHGSFAGIAEGAGIAFTRNGVREVLKPGDGDSTGLKYLSGKQDCLIVKASEGYCRD